MVEVRFQLFLQVVGFRALVRIQNGLIDLRLQLLFLHEQRCDGGGLTVSDLLDFRLVRICLRSDCVHFFVFGKEFLELRRDGGALRLPKRLNFCLLSLIQL